jgi:hypothetical protein
MTYPIRIGAERYLVETMSIDDAERVARLNGWNGDPEGLLDHCDAGQAARRVTEYATFDKAVAEAQLFERSGKSLFGAARVEHEIYEQAHDDRGRPVKGGSWETQAAWEVTHQGEPERIEYD